MHEVSTWLRTPSVAMFSGGGMKNSTNTHATTHEEEKEKETVEEAQPHLYHLPTQKKSLINREWGQRLGPHSHVGAELTQRLQAGSSQLCSKENTAMFLTMLPTAEPFGKCSRRGLLPTTNIYLYPIPDLHVCVCVFSAWGVLLWVHSHGYDKRIQGSELSQATK